MDPVSITLSVDEDSTTTIADLVAQFPEGSWVEIRVTEADPPAEPEPPSMPDYEGKIPKPPPTLPSAPWESTEDALRDLGEH